MTARASEVAGLHTADMLLAYNCKDDDYDANI
jgi:hypothetical protein